jgi:hypothetical protein
MRIYGTCHDLSKATPWYHYLFPNSMRCALATRRQKMGLSPARLGVG